MSLLEEENNDGKRIMKEPSGVSPEVVSSTGIVRAHAHIRVSDHDYTINNSNIATKTSIEL